MLVTHLNDHQIQNTDQEAAAFGGQHVKTKPPALHWRANPLTPPLLEPAAFQEEHLQTFVLYSNDTRLEVKLSRIRWGRLTVKNVPNPATKTVKL